MLVVLDNIMSEYGGVTLGEVEDGMPMAKAFCHAAAIGHRLGLMPMAPTYEERDGIAARKKRRAART